MKKIKCVLYWVTKYIVYVLRLYWVILPGSSVLYLLILANVQGFIPRAPEEYQKYVTVKGVRGEQCLNAICSASVGNFTCSINETHSAVHTDVKTDFKPTPIWCFLYRLASYSFKGPTASPWIYTFVSIGVVMVLYATAWHFILDFTPLVAISMSALRTTYCSTAVLSSGDAALLRVVCILFPLRYLFGEDTYWTSGIARFKRNWWSVHISDLIPNLVKSFWYLVFQAPVNMIAGLFVLFRIDSTSENDMSRADLHDERQMVAKKNLILRYIPMNIDQHELLKKELLALELECAQFAGNVVFSSIRRQETVVRLGGTVWSIAVANDFEFVDFSETATVPDNPEPHYMRLRRIVIAFRRARKRAIKMYLISMFTVYLYHAYDLSVLRRSDNGDESIVEVASLPLLIVGIATYLFEQVLGDREGTEVLRMSLMRRVTKLLNELFEINGGKTYTVRTNAPMPAHLFHETNGYRLRGEYIEVTRAAPSVVDAA